MLKTWGFRSDSEGQSRCPLTPPENRFPILAKNLHALVRVDPVLAKRLCEPQVDAHLEGEPPRYRWNRNSCRLALTAAEIDECVSGVEGRTLVMGMGLETVRRSHSIRARVQAILNAEAEHRTGRTAV